MLQVQQEAAGSEVARERADDSSEPTEPAPKPTTHKHKPKHQSKQDKPAAGGVVGGGDGGGGGQCCSLILIQVPAPSSEATSPSHCSVTVLPVTHPDTPPV